MEKVTGYILFLVFLLLGSVLLITDFPRVFSPPRSEREIILRSDYNDISRDMTVDSQGNVIIVGGRMNVISSSSMFHAVKVSASAQEIWKKTWNISCFDILVSVKVDSLDNIILAGISGFNQNTSTGLVMKLTPEGDLVWQVEYFGLQYNWYWWPPFSDFFGIEIDSATENIYVVGSIEEGSFRTLIACLNASGFELWRTEWIGPHDLNGTDATAIWLSSQEEILISGRVYGGDDPFYPFISSYLVAFDYEGNHLWNRSMNDPFWTGLETGTNEFVTTTDSWRGYNQVTRYTYDLEEISSLDLLVEEHYSISIVGFDVNGTENIIGYGEVRSLIAGAPVTRAYSPLFEGPQAPQTLVLSCTPSGELEWYDFLILGRMSEPCGVKFNSDRELIIAGHTSDWSFYENNFFIVMGFRRTPFPPDYQTLLLGFFPVVNVLFVALMYEIAILHKKGKFLFGLHSPGWSTKTVISRIFLFQVVLFILMYVFLIGFVGAGGPPPPLIYLPRWVAMIFWSLPIGILTLGIVYLIMRSRKLLP